MPTLDTAHRPSQTPEPSPEPASGDGLASFIDRTLSDTDIPEVTAMERAACAHPLHAWTDDNYRSSLRAGYWSRVRCDAASGRIVAVCVAMDGVDEVHLLNIAVAREWHGHGHARALLGELVARCQQRRAEALWLEVRPSNQRARALYLREGFTDIGVRRQYYPAATGREDALVMRRTIDIATEAGLSSDTPSEAPHALD